MILDFHAQTKAFTLTVARGEASVRDLMTMHGLDLSSPLSDSHKAVLYTRESYAAVAFFEHATAAAKAELMSLNDQVAKSWATSSTRHIDVPADKELSPFQVAGVDYVLSMGNTLIGDQPGLGKTMQAIAVANEMQAERVLVVCPANIRLQWCERIRSWTTMKWPYTVYPILHGRRGVHPNAEWTVISYDLARSEVIWRQLASAKYDLLILDEAHALKTIDAKRTRTVFGRHDSQTMPAQALAERATRVLALTGTPLPNRPREAYTLARGLCLGADTRVLTHLGVKPITAVLKTDLLWDGVEWVKHAGVIAKGQQLTLRAGGLSATPGHKVRVGGGWNTWQNVLGDVSIRSQALETGSASLRSLATLRVREAFVSQSAAHAEAPHTELHKIMSAMGEASAAKYAEIVNSLIRAPDMYWGARMTLASDGCSLAASLVSVDDVRIPETEVTHGMESVASGCGRAGYQTEGPSLTTSGNCPDVALPATNSTAEKTQKAMSRATLDGYLQRSTPEISAQLPFWSAVSESLNPVFDIVNAGPRRRFTIQTDAGPLVVHNCWDSIDWMSEDRFTERFNPSEQRETPDGKTYIDERSGRHFELQARLRANFMVRRLKRDVLPQLKVPFLDIVHVEETGAIKQALKAEKLLDIDPEDMSGLDMSVRGQVSTVRRMMGLALAPLAADYIEMLLDGGEEKIVVFAWHIEVLDILMAKLHRFSPLRIDGSTPATRKPQIVAQFATPGHRLLVGNILSMGTGTDGLQEACQRGVAAESSWVSGDNEQMVDRLDRMGQHGQVLFDFLVAPGSFSEHVLGSSLRKRKITHSALDQRLDDW